MVAEYTDADLDWVVENRTDGYVYTPGGQVGMALARNVGAGVYSYFTQDHLGSTRGLWDGDKMRLAKLNYAPYGEHDAVFGDAPDLQFTGKTWDSETGMYYFPYRMYSPSFKRWLTRDPLGMVDGPNVYAYVTGNPVMLNDPTGGVALFVVVLWMFATFVLFTLGYQAYQCVRSVIEGRWVVGGIPELNTGHKQHCYMGCVIGGECGRYLAENLGSWWEILENFSLEFNSADRGGAAAVEYGAYLAHQGRRDCVQACQDAYNWEGRFGIQNDCPWGL